MFHSDSPNQYKFHYLCISLPVSPSMQMEIPASSLINRYIACQGPLPNTCPDFWQMTWEQGSSMVVMLTTQVERGRVCESTHSRTRTGNKVSDSVPNLFRKALKCGLTTL